ncbi:MAG: hypothetical protein ACREIF_01900 [Chthoniobacterales bacterium]
MCGINFFRFGSLGHVALAQGRDVIGINCTVTCHFANPLFPGEHLDPDLPDNVFDRRVVSLRVCDAQRKAVASFLRLGDAPQPGEVR